jgi:hypothetical protein
MHDWVPLIVAVAALSLSTLSYLQARRALRLSGPSAVARLEQMPPGSGSAIFRLIVHNRGRAATTVERVQVENEAGQSRELDDESDFPVEYHGEHQLPRAPLGALRSLKWELGPGGIHQLLADEANMAAQRQPTQKIRAQISFGDGSTVKTRWARYE